MAYSPFYIRKQADGASTYNSATRWGIYCTDFPFKIIGDAKEVPSHSWNGEDGDEEYLPDELPMASYEIEVSLAYKGTKEEGHDIIIDFIKYVTGRDKDNKGSTFGSRLQIYDTYTEIGRQDCRFKSFSEKAYEVFDVVRDSKIKEIFTAFTITFKVNDPTTDVILQA